MAPYVRFALFRTSSIVSQITRPIVRFTHTQRRTLPEFSLDGQVAVVTGASQGLGQQILAAFALSGAHGAVVDLKQSSADESIQTLQKELKGSGMPPAKLHGYECDTSDEEAVKSTWDKIVDDFGKVDILVTNAGVTGGAPAEDYPFDDFKRMIDVNLNGTFLFAKTAGKWMIDNGVVSNSRLQC
jgi:sorbose reductase